MLELGTPGAYARSLGRGRLLLALRWGAAAGGGGVFLVLLAVLLLSASESTQAATSTRLAALVLGLPALALVGLGAYRARAAWLSAQQGFRGARSERRCARALRSLQPAALVHGALLGAGGDLDHAVLGLPLGGAAAVETKTGGGALRASGGRLLAGSRDLTSALEQARRQAQGLSRRLGAQVQPVVVVTDARGPALSVQGVLVCSLADLPGTLRGLRGSCTSQQAAALAPRLLSPPR